MQYIINKDQSIFLNTTYTGYLHKSNDIGYYLCSGQLVPSHEEKIINHFKFLE